MSQKFSAFFILKKLKDQVNQMENSHLN